MGTVYFGFRMQIEPHYSDKLLKAVEPEQAGDPQAILQRLYAAIVAGEFETLHELIANNVDVCLLEY